MPLARFERLEPDRRRRILAAAAQEFASKGYENASLGWIADESGFSKPALYYYFEDKADLYATVVRESWRRLSPQGHIDLQSLHEATFWPALEAYHLATFESTLQEPWLAAVWKLAYHPPPERRRGRRRRPGVRGGAGVPEGAAAARAGAGRRALRSSRRTS